MLVKCQTSYLGESEMNAKDTIMIARAARQFLWAMLLLSLDTLPAEGESSPVFP